MDFTALESPTLNTLKTHFWPCQTSLQAAGKAWRFDASEAGLWPITLQKKGEITPVTHVFSAIYRGYNL